MLYSTNASRGLVFHNICVSPHAYYCPCGMNGNALSLTRKGGNPREPDLKSAASRQERRIKVDRIKATGLQNLVGERWRSSTCVSKHTKAEGTGLAHWLPMDLD